MGEAAISSTPREQDLPCRIHKTALSGVLVGALGRGPSGFGRRRRRPKFEWSKKEAIQLADRMSMFIYSLFH
jgi:hypothetical protein